MTLHQDAWQRASATPPPLVALTVVAAKRPAHRRPATSATPLAISAANLPCSELRVLPGHTLCRFCTPRESMVVLDASRRNHPVPRLALWNPPQGETDHRSSSRVARDLRSPQLSFSGGSARFRGAQEPILDRCAGIDRKLLRLWQTTLL
jgi:hypothetical protein